MFKMWFRYELIITFNSKHYHSCINYSNFYVGIGVPHVHIVLIIGVLRKIDKYEFSIMIPGALRYLAKTVK